jgi:hypothetical protein
MGQEDRRIAQWGAQWLLNVISATAIITFNSLMMRKYLLMAPITVGAINSLFTAASIATLSALGLWGEVEKTKFPKKHLVAYALVSESSPSCVLAHIP